MLCVGLFIVCYFLSVVPIRLFLYVWLFSGIVGEKLIAGIVLGGCSLLILFLHICYKEKRQRLTSIHLLWAMGSVLLALCATFVYRWLHFEMYQMHYSANDLSLVSIAKQVVGTPFYF